jgi:hypothetical protein
MLLSFMQKVGIGPLRVLFRSFALCHGSCLLPLKLCSILRRTTSFGEPPAVRSLLCVRGHRRSPDASLAEHSIRDNQIRFHFPAATPELIGGDFVCLSKTAGSLTTTLAHSNNYWFLTNCVRLSVRNLELCSVTRLRGWFFRSRATFLSCHGSRPLAA